MVQNRTALNDTHSVSHVIDHDVTSGNFLILLLEAIIQFWVLKRKFLIVFGGDYYRLLTPGSYIVTVKHPNYRNHARRVKVSNPRHSEATRLDFWLEPKIPGEPSVEQEQEMVHTSIF